MGIERSEVFDSKKRRVPHLVKVGLHIRLKLKGLDVWLGRRGLPLHGRVPHFPTTPDLGSLGIHGLASLVWLCLVNCKVTINGE
jgi:hypothetical protein